MKKIILFFGIFMLLGAVCFGQRIGEMKLAVFHDISDDSQKTRAVQVPWNTIYIGVFIPDIDASTVGIEVFQHDGNLDADRNGVIDGVSSAELKSSVDTNWVPVLDLSDGEDAVICASGQDPGFMDLTPFVASLRGHWIRFTTGSAQSTGDDTYWVVFGSEAKFK